MAKITFSTPIPVGDLGSSIMVDELVIATISFNRQKSYTSEGKAVLSVGLEHPGSGWVHTITYIDAPALAFINALDKSDFRASSMGRRLLEKLVTDGKIQSGEISG